MSPYRDNYCDFQRFFYFRNKARNAGRSRKNAGNKPKCGLSRTIAGRLTPMRGAEDQAEVEDDKSSKCPNSKQMLRQGL